MKTEIGPKEPPQIYEGINRFNKARLSLSRWLAIATFAAGATGCLPGDPMSEPPYQEYYDKRNTAAAPAIIQPSQEPQEPFCTKVKDGDTILNLFLELNKPPSTGSEITINGGDPFTLYELFNSSKKIKGGTIHPGDKFCIRPGVPPTPHSQNPPNG